VDRYQADRQAEKHKDGHTDVHSPESHGNRRQTDRSIDKHPG